MVEKLITYHRVFFSAGFCHKRRQRLENKTVQCSTSILKDCMHPKNTIYSKLLILGIYVQSNLADCEFNWYSKGGKKQLPGVYQFMII